MRSFATGAALAALILVAAPPPAPAAAAADGPLSRAARQLGRQTLPANDG